MEINLTNLESMSDAELLAYYKKCETNISIFDRKQHALKILINSLYGCIGSRFFRLYNHHQATGITITGQAIVQSSEKSLMKYVQTITKLEPKGAIAIDTDSNYFDFTDVVNTLKVPKEKTVEFLDRLGSTKIQDILNKTFDGIAADTNAFQNRMYMKRENIGPAVFVASKNYVMKVYDSEGVRYKKPKLKVTGLESVKAATPAFFRRHLETGYNIAFDGSKQDLQTFVEQVRIDYAKLPLDEISSAKGVTEIQKYMSGDGFISGTPGHVRACIAYNRDILKAGLEHKYQKLRDGDKVRLLKLKVPNPAHVNQYAYLDKFPYELGLEAYVDRDLYFDDFFVRPLKRVFDLLNWQPVKTASLDDFF